MRTRRFANKIMRHLRAVMSKYCYYDVDEMPIHKLAHQSDKAFLGVSNTTDLITATLLQNRFHNRVHTFHRDITIVSPRKPWMDWIERAYQTGLITEASERYGLILADPLTNDFLTYGLSGNSVSINMYGSSNFVTHTSRMIEDSFELVTSRIEWMYSTDGSSINVPLNHNNLPTEAMYPFLKGESLQSYYDRFMNASSNILLLIGPPGTGKTTFIRGLLASTSSSALVTYDTNILEKDYVFAQFMDGDASVMVLEDSDAFLKSRSDGNTMMHRFLNVGDGLVTTKHKKLIFSTNLPSVRDIDPALIRPGRCFDIVTFDKLSQKDAETLAAKEGIVLQESRKEWTIAEVFNQQRPTSKPNTQSVGFI